MTVNQSTSVVPFLFESASVRVVMMDGVPLFSAVESPPCGFVTVIPDSPKSA